jgi:hypothetical protein
MIKKTKEEYFKELEKYNWDVRAYLLSMGKFKDVDISE